MCHSQDTAPGDGGRPGPLDLCDLREGASLSHLQGRRWGGRETERSVSSAAARSYQASVHVMWLLQDIPQRSYYYLYFIGKETAAQRGLDT